jgi:hypothetical protein
MKTTRILRTKLWTQTNLARGSKNPWDNVQGYPYNPVEDHIEPRDEEIISIY